MFFRQLIFSAVFIGIFSGLLLSISQVFGVTPILIEAELFEESMPIVVEAVAHQHHHDNAVTEIDKHIHHTGEAWAPEEGFERTAYTFIANILVGIGFASILLVFLSHFNEKFSLDLNFKQGLFWGLACYLIFFVIPSLGLPPEIPGSKADLLENRQSWWLLSVVCSAVGLLVLVFASAKFKVMGAVSLIIPFIVGAPHLDGPTFSHADPQAVIALNDLHQQFIVATSLSNFIFWVVLGISATWILKKILLKKNALANKS